MKIKYIDYGVGNRVGNMIYLNKNLKKYPKLHQAILKHEKLHSVSWNFKDFLLDLNNKEIKKVKREYFKFIIENPKSFYNFFPIMKIENKWTFDISIFFIWLFAIILGTIWLLL